MTPRSATSEKASAIATALNLLGNAYRGDWSDFDGRSLRSQLDVLAAYLVDDRPFDLDWWAATNDICPHTGGWGDYCLDRVPLPDGHPARAHGMENYGGANCRHILAIFEARKLVT